MTGRDAMHKDRELDNAWQEKEREMVVEFTFWCDEQRQEESPESGYYVKRGDAWLYLKGETQLSQDRRFDALGDEDPTPPMAGWRTEIKLPTEGRGSWPGAVSIFIGSLVLAWSATLPVATYRLTYFKTASSFD